MSMPYFPMYPTDFEAKTSHLTLEEGGAYNRLLRLMWMTPGCSLPDNEEWISRRMRVDAATFARVIAPLIEEFFRRHNGRIVSPALEGWVADARKTDSRPWVPLDLQRFVAQRDGQVCQYCGATEGPFHIDHIYPWSLGGGHVAENLTIACARCNWSKGSKTLAEWRGEE